MKRRSKVKFTQIHVSIPVHVLADFDATLRFSQSRSAKITRLMIDHLDDDGAMTIVDSSSRQLMAALCAREDVDGTMKALLLQILSKTP